jgi:hypothetical protein
MSALLVTSPAPLIGRVEVSRFTHQPFAHRSDDLAPGEAIAEPLSGGSPPLGGHAEELFHGLGQRDGRAGGREYASIRFPRQYLSEVG